ncbi:uncharacterized protein LOC133313126 [Gastrolobium bilobum]|uniref:uncharacterized protein LOC133313126 n=1 Tax=Gastrolobium bilobum TaxID=150636 RepID=UPI002AB19980|nr:uncharacterized protein LOC133313126 [Gastrolobium bilobum]
MAIKIPNLLTHSKLWRIVGILSSVVALVCYALSSSFNYLFGKWNVLKMVLYVVVSCSVCGVMLFATRWQVSRNTLMKAHVVFLALIITSLYSFFYDKAVNGKPDILSLISSGAFALMSLSFSRQTDLGFEVGVCNFFLGCLTVQLTKINLMLAFVAAFFCYSIIVLRSYSDFQLEKRNVVQDHVTVEIVTCANGVETPSHHENGMDGDNSSSSTNSYVKFSIKSFRIPELYIEIPETNTVHSLKRTVMEAVTSILEGGVCVC